MPELKRSGRNVPLHDRNPSSPVRVVPWKTGKRRQVAMHLQRHSLESAVSNTNASESDATSQWH
eukprot:6208426-Pleurochrysis_carterae.AAC.1